MITAFLFVALLQILVPAKMILDREEILNSGKEWKFRTAPLDPSDAFRGKYLTLSFKESVFQTSNSDNLNWDKDEPVYLILSNDTDGFAKIISENKTKPSESTDFLTAKVDYYYHNNKKLFLTLPFDRYYVEESKAEDAENKFNESLKDTNTVTYGIVMIKNGDAVLKDIIIGGVSVNEAIK